MAWAAPKSVVLRASASKLRAQRQSGAIIFVFLALTYAGCAQPLTVQTRSNVDAVGNFNVNADANVKAELSPTPRLQPVAAMGLPHRPQARNAPAIAIIDVDGLLLNNDPTGLGSWGENPVSAFR